MLHTNNGYVYFLYFEHPTCNPLFYNTNRLIIKDARKIRLVSASGSRHARVWYVIHSRLGRDTTASGAWFADRHRGRIGELLFRQHAPVEKAKKGGYVWGLERWGRPWTGQGVEAALGWVFKIQKNICAVLRANSIASVASLQGAPRGHLAEAWGEAL